MSEYIKLYELCQTMILGSVEDERVFNALSFLKSKVRNILDKNLESCLRLYVSCYSLEYFPYDKALTLWNSLVERRGVSNIITNLGDQDTSTDHAKVDFQDTNESVAPWLF